MKRTLITGILSAAVVATCLIARASSFVYSQNAGDFMNISQTGISTVGECPLIWQKGPFAIEESLIWTNSSGHELMLTGPHKPRDLVSDSTVFILGAHSLIVPLSVRSITVVGIVVLLATIIVFSGLLAAKIHPTRLASAEDFRLFGG